MPERNNRYSHFSVQQPQIGVHLQVFSFNSFCERILEVKSSGKSVGLCHGCFDVLHIGHTRHFLCASTRCDFLFVSVTADRFVNKGLNRPVFPDHERAEIISSLQVVSGVTINETATSTELLERARPNIYFKGQEYLEDAMAVNPNFLKEKDLALSLGIKVEFTFEKIASSTRIINKIRSD